MTGSSSQDEWLWYAFDRAVLQALSATKHKPSVSGPAVGAGVVRAVRQGPRKGERIRLLEVFVRPGGHVLLRVYPLTGAAWPSRTVNRLRKAHALLDTGLATASSLGMPDQVTAVIDAINAANAAIPAPVKPRRRRKKKLPPRIQVVSGGLPSLGRR